MKISEFMDALQQAFPKHQQQIQALAGSYSRVLAGLDGEKLRAVWQGTIDGWGRSNPPMPADFAQKKPHQPRPVDDDEAALAERVRTTKQARIEQIGLIDRTLKFYAETLSAHARECYPTFKRDALVLNSGTHTVTGPEIFRHCAVFVIDRKAWPLAEETARTNRGFAHVELGPDDWQDMRDRAETRIRGWSGAVTKAISRKPNRAMEEQRALLKRLAQQFRGEAEIEEGAA